MIWKNFLKIIAMVKNSKMIPESLVKPRTRKTLKKTRQEEINRITTAINETERQKNNTKTQ